MSKNNDLLRAEGINKSFGAVTAAKDINVGIKKVKGYRSLVLMVRVKQLL